MKIPADIFTLPPPNKEPRPGTLRGLVFAFAILAMSTCIHAFIILHAIRSPRDEKTPIYYLHTLPAGNPKARQTVTPILLIKVDR